MFFPCFDGYRALAAGAVLLLHVGVASGFAFRHAGLGRYVFRLDVGVAVFFLISGFLLYRPFAAAHLAGGEAEHHPALAASAGLLPRPLPPHLPRVLGRARRPSCCSSTGRPTGSTTSATSSPTTCCCSSTP